MLQFNPSVDVFSGLPPSGSLISVGSTFRMDEEQDVFPIMDFYLKHCDTFCICGVLQPKLRLLDVGKLDTLDAAADFLQDIVR